jgi:hypothetical protein
MIARHDGYKLPFVCVRRNNQITAGADERRALSNNFALDFAGARLNL